MQILLPLVIVICLVGCLLYYGYQLKLPIEHNQAPLISTLSIVTLTTNGKKEYREMCRVSVYSDSIVVMRLPHFSRYSHEIRDYTTGLAVRRSNFTLIRSIFNETHYRFAYRLTREVITSLLIDKNNGIATITYHEGNTLHTLRISKLLCLSPSYKQLINHLIEFV